MKKLRHYNKGLAVVLSVFGSSEPSAIQQYTQLYEEIKKDLPAESELRLAISSRTVLKNLEKQGNYHYTLVEQLAFLDRLGYRKIIVVSVNLFPTEEHEYLLQIVDAFRKTISCAEYEVTMPVFTKASRINNYLTSLNEQFRSEESSQNVVYIAHGNKNLNSSGSQIYSYVRDYLKLLNPRNFFYTVEGCFTYRKEFLLQEIERENHYSKQEDDVLLVPLLLVAGNHYKNDIQEIKTELNEKFDNVKIPESYSDNGDFSLLKLQEIRDYFKEEIQQSIKKITS